MQELSFAVKRLGVLGGVIIFALGVVASGSFAAAAEPNVVATLGDGAMFSITGLAFSRDGSSLICGGAGAHVYDTQSWKDAPPKKLNSFSPGEFSADGNALVGSMDNAVLVVDFPAWKQRFDPLPQTPQVGLMAISPDAKVLATAGMNEKAVTVWDATSGQRLRSLAAGDKPAGAPTSADFSPDGKTLAVGYYSGDLALWNVASGKLNLTVKPMWGSAQWCVQYSPDGKILATVDSNNNIVLVNAATLKAHSMLMKGHTEEIHSVCFNASGSNLISCSFDKTVRVWDTATASLIARMAGPARFTCVAVSPDGSELAAGNTANTVVVWNIGGLK
jgi:WD40 repeat protein